MPESESTTLDDAAWQEAQAVRREHEDLAEPRAMARFLAGLASPFLSRAKLTKHPLFGRHGSVPFVELLERASSEG